ncbi:MAG TPA: lipoyl synthase [Clostridia bacterium]|nr:lipoyl synthase [Thermoclostridium sp.]HZK56770.1 lipoyl synthase [Clostridia bacterium]
MAVKRKPEWLRINMAQGRSLDYVEEMLEKYSLNTVCVEANCPNRMECFSRKTATFMILGKECSRNCRFCNVSHGTLEEVNPEEPENLANAAVEMGLKHVVVTTVTRDDLPDGGAGHFAKVVNAIRAKDSSITIELLISDLKGHRESIKTVVDSKPEIINHNVETVPRLYKEIRPMAIYKRSLDVLGQVKEMDDTILTKSGMMMGLGETEEEVIEVMKDLRDVDCDFLTLGQYLAPSEKHYPVKEYVTPETFERYRAKAEELGFKFVASGPFVRSSYKAADAMDAVGAENQ